MIYPDKFTQLLLTCSFTLFCTLSLCGAQSLAEVIGREAESFDKQSNTDIRRWYRVQEGFDPILKREGSEVHYANASGGSYLEILPDTRASHDEKLISGENFSGEPGKLAILHYTVNVKTPGRYYVWVRAFSIDSEDNGVHVGINGTWPESGQRMQWCEGKGAWTWGSSQRTAEVHCGVPGLIYLDIPEAGKHEIQFSMREDGFEMDRWLMTTDAGYHPTGEKTTPAQTVQEVSGELKKWHKVTLTFDGPQSSEDAKDNPFMDYRLNVSFSHAASGKNYVIPGYFAADGNAGETSATAGNKWRAHFAPDETGEWTYSVDFRKGRFSAVSDKPTTGESGKFMDGKTGSFTIAATDKTGKDFRGRGRLQYVGQRYLKFAETGEYFLKQGPDAPENFLSYADFDGTFHNDGHKDQMVKTWEPHLRDWATGNPTWKNGKGKAIIGALNYLSSKGLNSVSFLTNNIVGDDQNVFPYVDYDTYDRIDVSKMEQWETVFNHAQQLGLFLHFKMLEVENQGLLDNGGVGAFTKLYFRELMARFGHHLALNWNLCEEDGEWRNRVTTPPHDTEARKTMVKYFKSHDPYHHHLVIHNGVGFEDLLGPEVGLTGPSVQTNKADFRNVHKSTLRWINASKKAGFPWAVAVDEPGDAQHSLITDGEDPDHDNARRNALWGTFMAGGWGNEWYFGYKHPHSDLSCEDYRSRDLFWDQAVNAMDFFRDNQVPYWRMENRNDLVGNTESDNTVYCLAETGENYVVYLNSGTPAQIDLSEIDGEFDVRWYNPKIGGAMMKAKISSVKGGGRQDLGAPPEKGQQDWAILITKTQ